MNNFKEIGLPAFPDLKQHLERLLANNIISWGDINQICINTTEKEKFNYHYGAGSLAYDWGNQKTVEENGIKSVIVPKKDGSGAEVFDTLCGQFENTIFETIYMLLTSKFKVGRVRLMNMPPKTCLSWHKDVSKRLHYPIVTQDGCLMVIGGEVLHLQAHKWYITDTTKKHTAVNASLKSRIHLVAELL